MKRLQLSSAPIIRLAALLFLFPLLGVTCLPGDDEQETIPPGGVYRSEDVGTTWDQRVLFEDGRHITSVSPRQAVIDSSDPSTLYIAAGPSGLLRTMDEGEVWSRVENPAATVLAFAIYPGDSNMLYLAGVPEGGRQGKIWLSTDRGNEWSEVYSDTIGERERIIGSPREEGGQVLSVDVSLLVPNLVFAASSTGALIASADGGHTWTQRHEFRQPLTAILLSREDENVIYARLEDGSLARSENLGDEFENISIGVGTAGLQRAAVLSLLEIHQDGELVLLAGSDRGLYRSDNAGQSWDRVPLPVTESPPASVSTIAQSVDGTLWAGSANNIYASRDGGITWRVNQFDFPNTIRFIRPHPIDASIVYSFFLP